MSPTPKFIIASTSFKIISEYFAKWLNVKEVKKNEMKEFHYNDNDDKSNTENWGDHDYENNKKFFSILNSPGNLNTISADIEKEKGDCIIFAESKSHFSL